MSRALALAHRLSGIALALFLPAHFWVLSRALELDTFLAWTEQPAVKAAEWGLVTLLALHLAGGLRVLALEFLPWRGWAKGLAAAAAAFALAAGLAFVVSGMR
ncbi:MAG: succinate dehydrogenase [Burkholderiales bacterium]